MKGRHNRETYPSNEIQLGAYSNKKGSPVHLVLYKTLYATKNSQRMEEGNVPTHVDCHFKAGTPVFKKAQFFEYEW